MPTTLKVAWVKEGKKRWEDWWVERRGYSLTKIPGLKDHVGFANYDLSQNDCPTLTLGDDVLEIADVTDKQLPTVLAILDYHGFQVVSDP